MAADKYRHAEDEYFKLRGQFDTGRLTQEQFDEKLRELMVQDEQGRYWMLGADSAKWYYYDGTKWVSGEPYAGATPPPLTMPASSAPITTPAPMPRPTSAPAAPLATTTASRGFPLVPVLLALALIIIAVVAFLVYQNRDQIFVAQRPPQITPVFPATITRAPSPTPAVATPVQSSGPPTLAPLATAVPTAIPPTELPTQVPPTGGPATSVPQVTIIVVTAEPSATIVLPTLLPTATNLPPTLPPPTIPPPTKTVTSVPPTNTPVPNCPSGVCVTKITYSPPAAKRKQNVTFTATFLNTTGGTAYYNWLILLYDPNKPGNNKGFGESQATSISIPAGQSEFSVTYVPVNGPGGCVNLYMRAGWKVSAFDKPIFPNTNGEPVTVFFDVCP